MYSFSAIKGLIFEQESLLPLYTSRREFRFFLVLSMMAASASLGDELSCSICLSLYTEPVSLRCDHNFCQSCVVAALDTQEGSGAYSCPECREEYPERPILEKNRKLRNIVENFRSTQPLEIEIPCTYCVETPVAAVKTCLHCETSMCGKHLIAHNKMVDHVLVEPTMSLSKKKCPIHKKLLEYYCSEDAACLCVSCCLVGEHKGHKVELLDEASEKKTEKLRDILKTFAPKRNVIEIKIQSLQEHKKKVLEKANDDEKRVTALFEDIRRELDIQEKRVLSDISRQVEQISQSVLNQIRQLETQKDELSRKMSHIEELCNMADPITILQDQHSDPEGQDEEEEPSVPDLDTSLISLTLHRSIEDLITNIKDKHHLNIQVETDLLLDENTANNYVALSEDLKTAKFSKTPLRRPELPERFTKWSQVMSVQSFPSGRHYWEVEASDSGDWGVGVSYPSIDRGGFDSSFGYNNKSWSFYKMSNKYSVLHNKNDQSLQLNTQVQKLGVYLDYEACRLSFFQLCDPIRHLHTFTTTFTEPLHAAFDVSDEAWVRIRSDADHLHDVCRVLSDT